MMKTKPFKHQQECFDQTKDLDYYGLLHEQGLGKSKVLIDTFCHKFLDGTIDAVLVLAPNAVAPNWKYDQLPLHMWDDVPYFCHGWDSRKTKTKKFRRSFDFCLHFDGLSIVTMNYEALITKDGNTWLREFFKERNVFMICDESHRIKNRSAAITKKVLAAGKLAKMRRIATGTVISNSAFDLFTQFNFLDPDILGYKSYYSFRNDFGVFKKQYGSHGKEFDMFVNYKNLDKLSELIKDHSSRLLKDDVLDLPDKIYEKRYVQPTPKMTKAYEQMKQELYVQLDNGEEINAPLAITCLMKLQQICSGFVYDEDRNTRHIDQNDNPRAKSLIDILKDVDGKVIIWAKFKPDFEIIKEHLAKAGYYFYKKHYVEYTGNTSKEDRETAKMDFQNNPDCKIFLANPAAAGEGLTLHAANTVIYYNNSFKYVDRVQGEDRAHRIGQHKNVLYIDMIIKDTVDEHITQALLDKRDIASEINGDKIKDWI